MPERCDLTELIKDQCAHCLGISDQPKPKPPSKAKRAESLAVEIEKLLLVMNTNRLMSSRTRVGGGLPLRHFDRAEPMGIANMDVTHADVWDDHFFRDAEPWDLPTRLDSTTVGPVQSGALHGEDMVVRRFRLVRKPYLPLHRITRWIVEVGYLAIRSGDGVAYPSLRYYGVNRPGDEWQELIPRNSYVVGKESEADYIERAFLINLECGIQLARDYAWRVHLKYADADIGIMLPTTPSGVRALFRLRDHEPGESRRKALTHWVQGHLRRTKQDSEVSDLVWVRDHLRGKYSFTWQDMQGVIYPSGYDLRRLADLKSGGRS